jgi:ATP/maltotriose-dependent transcriptional regulator MalT
MLGKDPRMATVAEQLVGRVDEVDALNRAVSGLADSGAGTLVVLGEPGIGKTRMLLELAARADEQGQIVLSGSASELESDLPFWVFVDALDEYVVALEPRRLESLEDDVRAELGRLLPSMSEYASAGEVAIQDERYRAHRAIRELLERLAATKPLVLILDDVHWADSASIELIGALLRRPPSAAVLLTVAARPRQLPPRLAAAIERARRGGSLTQLELDGLAREDAALLLGDKLDEDAAKVLYEESGGNPFFLEQLARAPRQAARSASGAPLSLAGIEVPTAVVAALTEELGLLPPPTRAFLNGAAVAGDPFEPELAGAASEVDEDASVHALDELLSRDLVRPTDVPRRFRFRHPLVRRAVYDAAPGGWRLGAHERCAAALAARGASPAARAHHVEHSARPGDLEAFAVLRDAGLASTLRAPASAARWFGAALRLLPDSAPMEERGALLMARGGALAATGRLAEARADLLATLGLVPSTADALRVKLIVACAGVEHLLGRHEEARRRLEDALEQLPDPVGPEAVALMVELAIDGLFQAEFDSMRDFAERAVKAAEPVGDDGLTATARGVLTLACAFTGAIEEAERHRSRAAAIVDAMRDDELAGRIDAAAHLAAAEIYLDRYFEAAVHAERALAVGRATGILFPTLVPTIGTAYFMRGRLADAAEVLDGGVEAARLADIVQAKGWSLFNRSMAAHFTGEVEAAIDMAEEALLLTRQLDQSFVSGWAGVALAAALSRNGEHARAVEVALSSAGGEELPIIPGGWRAFAQELLTRSYLGLGRREDAERTLATAVLDGEAGALPMARAWRSRAEAELALDAGDAATAAELALASAEAAQSAGVVVEAALSRTLAGRALAAAGRTDEATDELQRAADDLDGCGAVRYRDATERELRKLGKVVHRRTRKAGSAGEALSELSERELEVARLVVDRKTNREIAGELFVSLKTVEAHMRNLFRKLGVSSRIEVARTVERAERNKGSD